MAGLTVAQLAELCGGEVEGESDRCITGANSLENANYSDVSFVANRKAAEQAGSSQAGCLLVATSFQRHADSPWSGSRWSLIRVEDPRKAFVRALSSQAPCGFDAHYCRDLCNSDDRLRLLHRRVRNRWRARRPRRGMLSREWMSYWRSCFDRHSEQALPERHRV